MGCNILGSYLYSSHAFEDYLVDWLFSFGPDRLLADEFVWRGPGLDLGLHCDADTDGSRAVRMVHKTASRRQWPAHIALAISADNRLFHCLLWFRRLAVCIRSNRCSIWLILIV